MVNGAPSVLFPADMPATPPPLLSGDGQGVNNPGDALPWGIYLTGNSSSAAIQPDSIIAQDYTQDWNIPNYPIEAGGFEAYNKVTLPFINRVVMTKGGSDADRAAFLTACRTVAGDVNLYNIVTPDQTYLNCNITKIGLERRTSNNGVSLITVELVFQEIRLSAQSEFSTTGEPTAAGKSPTATARPSGQDPSNTGTVQPISPNGGFGAGAENGVIPVPPGATSITIPSHPVQ